MTSRCSSTSIPPQTVMSSSPTCRFAAMSMPFSWPRSLSIRTRSSSCSAFMCRSSASIRRLPKALTPPSASTTKKACTRPRSISSTSVTSTSSTPVPRPPGWIPRLTHAHRASSTPARTPKASTASIGKCSPCRAARPSPTPHYPRCWRWMSSRTQSAARWI